MAFVTADRGLHVVDLLQRGVKLGGEAGRRRPREALVGGAAGKFQIHMIFNFHIM